jgi:hypothetical protein
VASLKGRLYARAFRRRTKWLITLALAVVFLLVVAGAWAISAWRNTPKAHGIDVYQGEHLVATVDESFFDEFTAVTKTDGTGRVFTVIPLQAALERASTTPTLQESVRCTLSSGETVEITSAQLAYAYVAVRCDGKEIRASEGGPYPLVFEDVQGVLSRSPGLASIQVVLQE